MPIAANHDTTSSDAAGTGIDTLYLTAEAAAAALGVSVTSLYAYVSRKGIRSQAMQGKRARLYWRDDIERLANGKAEQRAIQWDSILVPETAITLLTETGHFYRGRSAIGLSAWATLEDVAALLWAQDREVVFPPLDPVLPPGFEAARSALAGLSSASTMICLLPILEASSTRNFDQSALGFASVSAQLLRWYAALVVGIGQPSAKPVHQVIAEGLAAPEGYDDIIRRILVLFADHELTAATYAVRAVANTGCTPYQAVVAGLVASRGRRIGEGRAPAVRRLVQEVLTDPDPGRPIIERYRAGEHVPGFSHHMYKGGDARARALLPVLQERLSDDGPFQRLFRAIEVAHDEIGVEPDLSLLSYAVEAKLGFPDRESSFSLIARLVGWLAHASEQMASGPMIRPRTAYTGPLPVD